ncbi:unnamed protein product [Sphagnum jensenii]|uniref:Secreted protein n=1 Tax=Sphagnum jensenii TaxID=128206 RepID=A0ABP1ATC6_9BRYO
MCLAQFCGVVSWSRFARISLISVADSEGSGRRSFVCCTRKDQCVRQQISTKRASNNGDAANTTCWMKGGGVSKQAIWGKVAWQWTQRFLIVLLGDSITSRCTIVGNTYLVAVVTMHILQPQP